MGSTRNYLGNSANSNKIVNPNLNSISREFESWGLDPRPNDGPAWSDVKQLANNGFHVQTDYLGAFGRSNWAVDWTALNTFNVINPTGAMTPDIRTTVKWDNFTTQTVDSDSYINIYPNPIDKETTIEFELTSSTMVNLDLYDAAGNKLESLISKQMLLGNYGITWIPNNLISGVYFIQLTTDYGTFNQKVIVK